MRLRRLVVALLGMALFAGVVVVAPPTADAAPSFADQRRLDKAVAVLNSLEQFAAHHGTYAVPDSGHNGTGNGWFFTNNSWGYTRKISDVLDDMGFLDSGARYYLYDSVKIQLCKDRVAVFTARDAISATSADRTWWTNNGCVNHGGYMKLSKPVSQAITAQDTTRKAAVAQVMTALNSYKATHGHYMLDGSAGYGSGVGWYKYQKNSYKTSIANLLIQGGHMTASAAKYDPTGDFLVYRCKDRIAVFAKPQANLVPVPGHVGWWSSNGCTQWPINSKGYTYFLLSPPSGYSQDDRRADVVGEVVDALEAYGTDNYSYTVAGGGGGGNGQGWYQYVGGNYTKSIAQVLVDGGYLPGGYDLPVDPWDHNLTTHSGYDLLIYRCKDRIGVFSRSDGKQPSTTDRNWWSANNCTTYPSVTLNHPYFQVSSPVQPHTPNDLLRIEAVDHAIGVFEAYERSTGSYYLNGGYHNSGLGRYKYRNGSSYSHTMVDALIESGHLTAASAKYDPTGDFYVYRCKDRIGVFAKPEGPNLKPTASDLAWWTSNGCTQYPNVSQGHSYFRLSVPSDTSQDDMRVAAVSDVVDALEAYGADTQSYIVYGGGNGGQGWYQYTNGTSYKVSIAQVLVDGGYLPGGANLPTDPWDYVVNSHTSYDFLIYRCLNRIAVFSRSDGVAPTAADSSWWSNNNCQPYPLNNAHPYFEISEPLIPTCHGKTVTVNMTLGQTPTNARDVILGTPGDDVITVWNGETVCSGDGNDTITANQNNILVDTGAGDDTVRGQSSGNYVIHLGPGDDTFIALAGSNVVQVHGGDGNDIIKGGPSGDKLYGGEGADTIEGGAGGDEIHGLGGNDILRGHTGNDTIYGGDGNDQIAGHEGNDEIHAGAGVDKVWGHDGWDTLNGGAGNDDLRGGPGDDDTDGGTGTDICHDADRVRCETLGDPTPPSNFTFVVTPGGDHVVFNWTAATDNVGVVSYEVYADGVRKWLTYNTTLRGYVLRGLNQNQAYDFSMAAVDDQGNKRTLDPITATTRDLIFGPSWGDGAVYATAVSDSGFTATWDDTTEGTTADRFEVTVRSGGQEEVTSVPVTSAPYELRVEGTFAGQPIVGGQTFSVSVVIHAPDGDASTTYTINVALDDPPPPPAPTPEPIPPAPPGAGPAPVPDGPVVVATEPPATIPGLGSGEVAVTDIFPYPPSVATPDLPVEMWDCQNSNLGVVATDSVVGISWYNGPPAASANYRASLFPNPSVYGPTSDTVYRVNTPGRKAFFSNLPSDAYYMFTVEAFDSDGRSLGACRGSAVTSVRAVPQPTTFEARQAEIVGLGAEGRLPTTALLDSYYVDMRFVFTEFGDRSYRVHLDHLLRLWENGSNLPVENRMHDFKIAAGGLSEHVMCGQFDVCVGTDILAVLGAMLSGCWSAIVGAGSDLLALVSPQTWKDLWAVVDDLPELISNANGAELVDSVARSALKLDVLENDGAAVWAGSFGCQIAIDLISGTIAQQALDLIKRLRHASGKSDVELPGDNDPDGDGTGVVPCRSNSSFPGETQVLMADGSYSQIDEIRPGDWVISHNLDTSVWEPKLVVDQWSHPDRGPPTTVTLDDGSTVTATDDHRFWVESTDTWTELQHVQSGDQLLTPSGTVIVDGVVVGPPNQAWTVWELTVADNHNFTVSTGTVDVLVHNEVPCAQVLAAALAKGWASPDLSGPELEALYRDATSYLDAIDGNRPNLVSQMNQSFDRLARNGWRFDPGTGGWTNISGSSPWSLGAFERGKLVEDLVAVLDYPNAYRIGQESNGFFPLIDLQDGGVLTSIKSIDRVDMSSAIPGMESHIDDLAGGLRDVVQATPGVPPLNAVPVLDIRVANNAAAQALEGLVAYGETQSVLVVITVFQP